MFFFPLSMSDFGLKEYKTTANGIFMQMKHLILLKFSFIKSIVQERTNFFLVKFLYSFCKASVKTFTFEMAHCLTHNIYYII